MIKRLIGTAVLLAASAAGAQSRRFSLESVQVLELHNAVAQPAQLAGKRGVRLTTADRGPLQGLAVITGLEFSNGVIEIEIAGEPAPDAGEGARGFVGVAFRVQPDMRTYDAFYIRPTNGRADDQVRRNHATQYISHPDWPWAKLRSESPSKYESYVDLQPGVWTKIRIEVQGNRARLMVHGQQQPALIVNDVKSGTDGKGGVALWLEPGTIAHYRNLTVTPAG